MSSCRLVRPGVVVTCGSEAATCVCGERFVDHEGVTVNIDLDVSPQYAFIETKDALRAP